MQQKSECDGGCRLDEEKVPTKCRNSTRNKRPQMQARVLTPKLIAAICTANQQRAHER